MNSGQTYPAVGVPLGMTHWTPQTQASEDKCIWTKKVYDNFVLDLEFKNAPETNSGVIVYCSDAEDWIPNSVEIQIADDYNDKWAKAFESLDRARELEPANETWQLYAAQAERALGRTADALAHVVRAFGDDINPARDVASMEAELILADQEVAREYFRDIPDCGERLAFRRAAMLYLARQTAE